MVFGLKAKLAAVALSVSMAFGAGLSVGWVVKGKFEDSKELASVKAQQALADEIRNDMGKVVRTVEDQLQGLKANERIIDRGIIREVERPVYRNVCVPPDSDAFRLLRSLAIGEAPGKPADQGADDAAAID